MCKLQMNALSGTAQNKPRLVLELESTLIVVIIIIKIESFESLISEL